MVRNLITKSIKVKAVMIFIALLPILMFTSPAQPQVTVLHEGAPFSTASSPSIEVSPDGQWLYVGESYTQAVYKMPASGGTPVKISYNNPLGAPTSLTVSPDGTTVFVNLAHSGLASSGPVVVSLPAMGGTAEVLTALPKYGSGLAISPDGETLYISQSSETRKLWTMPSSGGSLTPLLSGGGFDFIGDVAISNSGSTLFLGADGNDHTYKMPATGGPLTDISPTNFNFADPVVVAVSPDGSKIYVLDPNIRIKDGQVVLDSTPGSLPGGVFVGPTAGGPYSLLFAGGAEFGLQGKISVSPDGKTLYFGGYRRSSPSPTVVLSIPTGFQNQAPVAIAGPDQGVTEGALVTLQGSGTDPEGSPVTYQWTQIAGTEVTLSGQDAANCTFTAPVVGVGGETLTFALVVSDGVLSSPPDTVNITVSNVNKPPVADAGDPQTVNEGSQVTLVGSLSYDPDDDALFYSWTQTNGTTVELIGADKAKPSFVAPLVGAGGAALEFQLVVSDGALSSDPKKVTVTVENVNHAPVAKAGENQTQKEGNPVTLDGTQSYDPDGETLRHSWEQVGGIGVSLSGADTAAPKFTAPAVAVGGATLVFRLVVNDGLVDSEPAEVTITVQNVNDPPACDLAQAKPGTLWPPNHKLVPVEIVGVTDPNNDNVTITITGVTQDEPVNGLGDGDTSPDAVIQGNKVLLRAERAGNGNGRVYHITFTATDGNGATGTGTVSVSVPHDKGKTAVDDGLVFDSTQP